MYGIETGSLTKTDENNSLTFEKKMLRKITFETVDDNMLSRNKGKRRDNVLQKLYFRNYQ